METLLCERCGGPLPRTGAREVVTCTFCGTSAAPPPAVVEKIVERVQVVEARAGSEVHCPRCGGALRDTGTTRASLRVCRSCGGAWVDTRTVERLTRERDDDLVDLARRSVGAFAPKDRDRRPLLSCPHCGAALRRQPLGQGAESSDVCATHGAFFDHGELKTFVDAEAERRAGVVGDDDVVSAGIGGWRWPWS